MRSICLQPAVLASRHGPARIATTCSLRNFPRRFASHPKPATPRRFASSSTQSAAAKTGPSQTELDIPPAAESTATIPSPSTLLNPPATTRPAPLDVPSREPSQSLPGYLFTVGKTYIKFYKNGLRAILTNRKLLSTVSSTAAPPKLDKYNRAATFPTRADVILQRRTRHDIARLPAFGLIILICGEFTPLIVVAFPKLTPYTCRIPKQIDILRSTAETRRAESFKNLKTAAAPSVPSPSSSRSSELTPALKKLAPGHIARTLSLTSRLWDRIGLDSPLSGTLAARAVRGIAADDKLIKRDGGVAGLVDDEVILACEERGMNVRGQNAGELRRRLEEWVRITTRGSHATAGGRGHAGEEDGQGHGQAEDAVRKLLLTEEVIVGKGVKAE